MKISKLGKVVCDKDHQNTEIKDLINTYGLTFHKVSKDV